MIKAKRLQKGDTIGVVSPASPSATRSEVPRAVEYIEEMGYRIALGENVNKQHGFTAASEEERAHDINEMFRRDDVDAIFVTQGGYGSAQLIDRLDYDLIANNPKIFTGFSDLTSLHLAIGRLAGLVTFHGPGMSRFNSEDLTDYTKEYFFKALAQAEPIGNIPVANEKKWLYTMAPGVAEGALTGGNLTLVCASLGTRYEIDTAGKILLLEEVESEPWIMDHNLSHLRNAGKLKQLAGVVIGECHACVPNKHEPGFYSSICAEEVLEYYLQDLGVPVLYGLPLGHTDDLATLPMGVQVRLDADRKTFEVLESGVR
ncbi:MAG: LD-carboxypeptidase [Anaerovoracaceae bacterium]|jgi:muramoyltetrapeptide carboxypeptidase